MDESNFHELADELLDELAEAIEMADPDGLLDVDISEGVLTIEIPDDGEYVINKHAPTVQIWVSSPVSGASYYSYDEGEGEWMSEEGRPFKQMLVAELSDKADLDLEF